MVRTAQCIGYIQLGKSDEHSTRCASSPRRGARATTPSDRKKSFGQVPARAFWAAPAALAKSGSLCAQTELGQLLGNCRSTVRGGPGILVDVDPDVRLGKAGG